MTSVSRVVAKSYTDRCELRDGPFGRRYYTIIYAIEAVGADRIKFGRTLDVAKRFCSLSTASPVPLKLTGHVWLPDDAESDIHTHLRTHRSHGEWFYATPEVWEVANMIFHKDVRALARLVGIIGLPEEISHAPD